MRPLSTRLLHLLVHRPGRPARTASREDELVAQAFRCAQLADAVRRLTGALDPGTVYQAAVECVCEYARADGVRLWLAPVPPHGEAVVRTAGVVPAAADPAEPLAYPLVAGGQTLGVLEVWPGPSPFGRPTLPLDVADGLEMLAGTAAAAIEVSRLHVRLAEQLTRDPLTGLFNRRRLDEDLALETALAGRNGQPLALVMLDLDFFKDVNDRDGHLAGDELLRAVAGLLQRGVRAADNAYRYGGEEFTLLLRAQDGAAGLRLSERLRTEMSAHFQDEGVTASFGVASVPEHAADARGLLVAADTALYRSKHRGRDQVCLAPPRPTR